MALGVFVACPAAAQDVADPNVEARQAARALAERGAKLVQEGQYELAIQAFREADQRFHAPTILLEQARAHVRLGQLVEAQAVYSRIVGEQFANYAPPQFFKAQRDAGAELTALGPRIPTLRVVLRGAPPQGVEITLDGAPIAPPADRLLPRNPGRHVIVVRAPGRLAVTREVTLNERAAERVVVELQRPPPPAPSLAPTRPAAAAPPPADPPASPGAGEGGSLLPALLAFGAGGAGLGVGVVAGALALGKTADLDERCPDRICEQTDKEDHAAAGTLATVSTIGFIAGGVGVAAGAALLVLRPGVAPPARTGLIVGPGWIGLSGGF